MRGRDQSSGNLFSYVDLEERVRDDHPLRLIREIVNDVLGSLSSEFETLYSHMGRPSIPPERWFVGLGLDDGVWDGHFSVDGTLIVQGEDDGDGGSGRNAERDFHVRECAALPLKGNSGATSEPFS